MCRRHHPRKRPLLCRNGRGFHLRRSIDPVGNRCGYEFASESSVGNGRRSLVASRSESQAITSGADEERGFGCQRLTTNDDPLAIIPFIPASPKTRSLPSIHPATDVRLGRILRLLMSHATVVVSGTKIAEEIGTSRSEVWRM